MPIDGHVDLILRVEPAELITTAELRKVQEELSRQEACSIEDPPTQPVTPATSVPTFAAPQPAHRSITGEWIMKCEIHSAFLDPDSYESSAVPPPSQPASQCRTLASADVDRFWRIVRLGKKLPWSDPKFTIKAFYASLKEEVGHPDERLLILV